MKNKWEIFRVGILIISSYMLVGCQDNSYHAVEYFDNGKIKKEINGTTSGVPEWSNKDFNAIKIGG